MLAIDRDRSAALVISGLLEKMRPPFRNAHDLGDPALLQVVA
jgi:hypothetical protein